MNSITPATEAVHIYSQQKSQTLRILILGIICLNVTSCANLQFNAKYPLADDVLNYIEFVDSPAAVTQNIDLVTAHFDDNENFDFELESNPNGDDRQRRWLTKSSNRESVSLSLIKNTNDAPDPDAFVSYTLAYRLRDLYSHETQAAVDRIMERIKETLGPPNYVSSSDNNEVEINRPFEVSIADSFWQLENGTLMVVRDEFDLSNDVLRVRFASYEQASYIDFVPDPNLPRLLEPIDILARLNTLRKDASVGISEQVALLHSAKLGPGMGCVRYDFRDEFNLCANVSDPAEILKVGVQYHSKEPYFTDERFRILHTFLEDLSVSLDATSLQELLLGEAQREIDTVFDLRQGNYYVYGSISFYSSEELDNQNGSKLVLSLLICSRSSLHSLSFVKSNACSRGY